MLSKLFHHKSSVATMAFMICGFVCSPVIAQETSLKAQAQEMSMRAIAYLNSVQDNNTGGWSVPEQGPVFPAITGLVVTGMLLDDRIDATDPSVARGLGFILEYAQDDGGIYDQILPSYNTSICLSALALADTNMTRQRITPAQTFLRSLQYGPAGIVDPRLGDIVQNVSSDHPFFGGIGYGKHGRPDLSNLSFMLQGLHDSGVPGDDPAFKRALKFLERTQMHDAVNDMDYANGSSQGGFIYATSTNKDHIGSGESKAGMIDESRDNNQSVSRLRAYGSMTYAGFKSYLYADLAPDDPRVTLAQDWISRNYTLSENPGVGQQGLYYYFVTLARALDALDSPDIHVIHADGTIQTRSWAQDLVRQLQTLQEADGSFRSVNDRWMESNKVLITAYALIALEEAKKYLKDSPASESDNPPA